jgi:hypothetical protein
MALSAAQVYSSGYRLTAAAGPETCNTDYFLDLMEHFKEIYVSD